MACTDIICTSVRYKKVFKYINTRKLKYFYLFKIRWIIHSRQAMFLFQDIQFLPPPPYSSTVSLVVSSCLNDLLCPYSILSFWKETREEEENSIPSGQSAVIKFLHLLIFPCNSLAGMTEIFAQATWKCSLYIVQSSDLSCDQSHLWKWGVSFKEGIKKDQMLMCK